ncbi:MAG TPA: SURF1 family protein [Pseudolysinimonas sp.]|nr:SURF1 family protein [Pseudolysinimonas sp.]
MTDERGTTAPRGVRRWGGYVALVVVFAVVCGLLSWWQWARRTEAVTEIHRVAVNFDARPMPLATALPSLAAWDEDEEWRPVELRGRYLVDEQLLVRNRPYNGNPGYEQLVPVLLDDGTVFVVDRGWIPSGDNIDKPDSVPSPPSGTVTIVARLKPGEPVIPGRGAPHGQIATINLPTVAHEVDRPSYTGAYGLLDTEDPATAAGLPALKPDADEGPHLSYALQWIAFGILAFIGLAWAFRRERRIAALPVAEQAAARNPKRRSIDSDVEDDILDRMDQR